MSAKASDGMLREWGTRLFYGMPKKPKQSRGGVPVVASAAASMLSADVVRERVRNVIRLGAHQVMVKITGGGRGMKAIAAHMRYISRQGKPEAGGRGQSLELEDENGDKISGTEAIQDLQHDWRMAGSYIGDDSARREAFNIILSMPEGTPPDIVRDAAHAFARETFEDHKYVFVLHEDTASPHVHLAVRSENRLGVRLNPRKADLQRWRERFAARLQDRGINAVALRASTRGVSRVPRDIWQVKAAADGHLRKPRPVSRSPGAIVRARAEAIEAWGRVAQALAESAHLTDRELAMDVVRHVGERFGSPAPEPSRTVTQPRRGSRERE
jgi:hypothetical protein